MDDMDRSEIVYYLRQAHNAVKEDKVLEARRSVRQALAVLEMVIESMPKPIRRD